MANSKGTYAIITTITVNSISAAIVLVRLWIRMTLVRAPGWDDLIIIIAATGISIMTVMISQQVKWGLGRHIEELDETTQEKLYFYFWLSIIFYNVGLGSNKISILMQYLRIFAISAIMQLAIHASLAFSVLYALETVILSIFSCTPVDRFWYRQKPGTCVDFKALWFCHAAFNIFSDILIISLPMPVIRGLNIPREQKMALMAIFALGAFGCVTSMLRLKALRDIADSTDDSYDNVNAAVWSNVEVNVGIMCASLPTFKAFLKRYLPRISTDQSPRSAAKKYGVGGGWRSRNTPYHGTLISLDGMERGDAGQGRPDGTFTTTIEKDTLSYAGSDRESSRSDSGGGGIKVTTEVSQREDSNSDKQALDANEVHSISESERRFFTNS